MKILYLLLCITLLVSCKPGRPDGILSEKKMEDVLVDYHLAQAIAEVQTGDLQENRYLMVQEAFKKNKVTEAQFDSSLVYWCRHSEQFVEICGLVSQRLSYMIETEGVDQQKNNAYSHLATEGDTANVWNLRKGVVLLPNRAENIYSFSIEADSTYHCGDSFVWAFSSQFISKENFNEAYALLSIRYDNDSIVGTTRRLSSGSQTELRLNCLDNYKDNHISSINGTIYMPIKKEGFDILAINDFALIRYHNLNRKQTVSVHETDTLRTDSVRTNIKADTLRVRQNPYDIRDEQADKRTIRIIKDKPIHYPMKRK